MSSQYCQSSTHKVISKVEFQKFLYLFIMVFLISSCHSTHTPPKIYDFEKTKVIDKSLDLTWTKIVTWFGENNVPIKNIDKNSGFLSTEYTLSIEKSKEILDCGVFSKNALHIPRYNQFIGNFNIIVEKINDTQTKVTINTFFTGINPEFGNLDCNSTGILENDLFTFISE